jgi:hypothetical protein
MEMDKDKPLDKPAEPPPAGRLGRVTPPAPAPASVTMQAYVAPAGGVVAGRGYWIDGHLLIADTTAEAGVLFHARTGVVDYDKVHEEAWTAGDLIYWYAIGGCMTNGTGVAPLPGTRHVELPSDVFKVGAAELDAPRPSTTGRVKLDPLPTEPGPK